MKKATDIIPSKLYRKIINHKGNKKVIDNFGEFGKIYYDPHSKLLEIKNKNQKRGRLLLDSIDDYPARVYFRDDFTIRSAMWYKDGEIHRQLPKPAYINWRPNGSLVEEYWNHHTFIDKVEVERYKTKLNYLKTIMEK